MSFPIQLHNSQSTFHPAKDPIGDWVDTSFAQSVRAVGRLRIPSVSNGRYESKHPILNASGNPVGFMTNGVDSLGYTFTCVYAGDCFWITHQGFGAVLNGVNVSRLSLVDETGKFFFSKNRKFEVVKSFSFGGSWVDTIRAFKLLDEGRYLFYLTDYGFCLFDTGIRDSVAKVEFTNLAYQWSGFALSLKSKLLVLGCSERGNKDPSDGEYRYINYIRVYNLENGDVVGEQYLPGDQGTRWNVEFSEDGRQLCVSSDSSKHVFEMTGFSNL